MNSNQRDHEERTADSDLLALARAVWRRRYVVLVSGAVTTTVALIIALTAEPAFRAEVVVTQVREDPTNAMSALASQVGGLATLMGVNLQANGGVRDAAATLSSRLLISEFITRNIPLSELLPTTSKPPTLWRASKEFREHVVTIQEDGRKGTITVAMTWKDPALAAKWANGFVGLANEMLRSRAIDEASRNISYLKKQIEQTDVVELQHVMYGLVESETKKLMLANGRDQYAFTIVDPAVPPEIRSSPRRTLIVVAGAFIGGMLGVIISLLLNLRRDA